MRQFTAITSSVTCWCTMATMPLLLQASSTVSTELFNELPIQSYKPHARAHWSSVRPSTIDDETATPSTNDHDDCEHELVDDCDSDMHGATGTPCKRMTLPVDT